MERTIFNQAQIEMLGALSAIHSEADLYALKHAISEFFANRADKEMEKLWENGTWNEQTLKDLRTAHYRTPYEG
jgi:hypothetical protein